jgi:PhnB protein
MYTELMIAGDVLRFCDASSGNEFIIGNNISLTIISEDIERTTTYFNRMKENGTVEMDLQETFWSKCFGSVKDKYGVIWQFDTQEKKTVE